MDNLENQVVQDEDFSDAIVPLQKEKKEKKPLTTLIKATRAFCKYGSKKERKY
jgi:hypothetical protein